MDIFGITDTGVVRSINQDSFAQGKVSESLAWAVVCDGMGGVNGGDYASRTAVESMTDYIGRELPKATDTEAVKDVLCDAINEANTVVFNASQADLKLRGMGTTVVAAVIMGNELILAHSGDSRAYVASNSGLRQVTIDHSLVQEMVNSGEITQEEARVHPRKNVITRALGVEDTIEIDFSVITLDGNETVLLCSDGLTNFLSDSEIYEMLRSTEAASLPKALVDAANENGGGDNITAVIMCAFQKKED